LVKKVSLSLPDRLFEELDGLAKESSRTRSSIVVEALKAYLSEPDIRREAKTYPTALQKLREQIVIKLRSPRLAKARIESDWIVKSEV